MQLIQTLTTKLGLNLAGVEHVLRLEDELRRVRTRMEQLEARLKAEIHETHSSTGGRSWSTVPRSPRHRETTDLARRRPIWHEHSRTGIKART